MLIDIGRGAERTNRLETTYPSECGGVADKINPDTGRPISKPGGMSDLKTIASESLFMNLCLLSVSNSFHTCPLIEKMHSNEKQPKLIRSVFHPGR